MKNKVIIEHNDGDSQNKGNDDIRLANLQIKGQKCAILILPCFNSIIGTVIKRLTVEFEKPIDLESTSDYMKKKWQKGVNLVIMNLKDKIEWPSYLLEPMEYAIQMVLLGYPKRNSEEDCKKFYEMLDKYRDEIKTLDKRYRVAYRKKEQEIGLLKMRELNHNEESAILEKFPKVEDKELMGAVIKKVLDETELFEEQSYGEKVIKEHLEIVKERVKETSHEKGSRPRRYKRR